MIIKEPPVYDTSHWRNIPDFALVRPRPFLVITKATEGNWYQDPTFAPYFRDLQQDGIHRGAFHFNRKSISGVLQAQYFCNFIKPHVTNNDILALDVEEGGESASQLQAWFAEVIRQFPVNHAKRLVMIYSRENILKYIPMTEAQKGFFTDIPIWTAGYPNNPDLFSSVPADYIPDQSKYGPVWLWQYTDRGRVAGINEATVDCNWIAPELISRLGGITPPPPTNGETMNLIVNTTGLNGRATPNGTILYPVGSTSAYFRRDDKLESPEYVVDSNQITKWYRITRCERAGVVVALPAVVWASDGGTAQYLLVDTTVPPPVNESYLEMNLAAGSSYKLVINGETKAEGIV